MEMVNLCTTKVTNMSGSGNGGPFQGGITRQLKYYYVDINRLLMLPIRHVFSTEQDISNWDTSNVTDKKTMFNSPIIIIKI